MGFIAPRIKSDGTKFDGHKPGEPGYEFCQIPNRLLAYVMREIDGNSGNRLKLMIFLMGCGDGFEIHEKTIMKRTGMSQSSYNQARDWLDKNYFITYKKGCNDATIKVNYAYMWSEIKTMEFEDYEERVDEAPEPEETRKEVVIGSQVWTWEKFNLLKKGDYFERNGLNKQAIEYQLRQYLPASAEK